MSGPIFTFYIFKKKHIRWGEILLFCSSPHGYLPCSVALLFTANNKMHNVKQHYQLRNPEKANITLFCTKAFLFPLSNSDLNNPLTSTVLWNQIKNLLLNNILYISKFIIHTYIRIFTKYATRKPTFYSYLLSFFYVLSSFPLPIINRQSLYVPNTIGFVFFAFFITKNMNRIFSILFYATTRSIEIDVNGKIIRG